MMTECNGPVEIDLKASFFTGDAAGRPAKGTRKKDFNDTDLKFALNIGIPFETPEMCFLGSGAKDSIPTVFAFDPRNIWKSAKPRSIELAKEQELVMLVGPPGGGKTTICKKLFPSYVHVNQDTLKTYDKCQKVAMEAIERGDSVVVDNQNKEKSIRKKYLDMAVKRGIKARAIFINYPKELCFHLNAYRMLNPRIEEHRKVKVPAMIIHSFYKYVEKPRIDEGLHEVIELTPDNFCLGPFDNKEDETLINMFLV